TLATTLLFLPTPRLALGGFVSDALAAAYQDLSQLDAALGVSRLAAISALPARLGARRTAALALVMVRSQLSRLLVVWEMGVPIPIPTWFGSGGRQLVSTAPPSALSVSTILITPARQAAYVGDRVGYTAQSRDTSSAVVHGIKHSWSVLQGIARGPR